MKQPHGKGGVCSRRDGVPGPRALESVARGGEHCCVAASEQERRERRTTLPDPFQSGCSVRALSVSEANSSLRSPFLNTSTSPPPVTETPAPARGWRGGPARRVASDPRRGAG